MNATMAADERERLLMEYCVHILSRVFADDLLTFKLANRMLKTPHFLLGAVILIVNLLFFFLLILDKHLRSHAINIPICLVSLSDSFFGVRTAILDTFLCPCSVRSGSSTFSLAYFHVFLSLFSITDGAFLLLLIMFLRYRAIAYPFRPNYSYRRVCCMAVITFLLALLVTSVGMVAVYISEQRFTLNIMWHVWSMARIYDVVYTALVFVLPLLAMTFMVSSMAWHLLRRTPHFSCYPPPRRAEGVKMVLALYFSYSLLCAPYWCHVIYMNATMNDYYDRISAYIMRPILTMIMFSQGLVNVVIYCTMCANIRNSCRRRLGFSRSLKRKGAETVHLHAYSTYQN